MDIDFEAMTAEVQREINDASGDFHYVNKDFDINGMRYGGGVVLDGDEASTKRRLEMLKFSVIQTAKLWRANGGIGQMLVRFHPGSAPNCVEAELRVCTHPNQYFDLIREGFRFTSLQPAIAT
jgi:hypothetical protein